MVQEELTKEDIRRVNRCEFYQMTKNIMKSHEVYKELEIGDVYFIKMGDSYVSRSYGGKRDKFMVFHKDEEGFVFVKRINATGKLGKEVQCLTTQYPAPRYQIEADPEYLDSIIFENEGGYDPLKAEKELNKLKGKARRRNKKLELKFDTPEEAFKTISEYKMGDTLYDANTTYGQGVMIWTVVNVESRPVDRTKTKQSQWSNKMVIGKTREDREHIEKGLTDFYQIRIKVEHQKPESRRWTSTERTITFSAFTRHGNAYYKSKPYTTDDV